MDTPTTERPSAPSELLLLVRSTLMERHGTWVEIARESGVPLSTIRKIAHGHNHDPRVYTVDRLRVHFGISLGKPKRVKK